MATTPMIMTGEHATVSKAILQEMNIAMSKPSIRLRKDSTMTEIVSVVIPLSAEISSESTFVRMPGALSSLSNH